MATIADLDKRLAALAASNKALTERVEALEARLETDQSAKIKELEDRVAVLEADGNNLRFDHEGELGPDDVPTPEMFKKVGDWLTDKFGRWWTLSAEDEVEMWREDYVVEPSEI